MKSPIIFHFTFTVQGQWPCTFSVFSSITRREDNNWMAMKAEAETKAREKVGQKFPQPFYTITDVVGVEMSHDGVIVIEP